MYNGVSHGFFHDDHFKIFSKRIEASKMETGSREVDFIWEATADQPPDLQLDAFFNSLFDCMDLDNVEIAILATDDEAMRALNNQYRNKDRTTDVLSFPSQAGPAHEGPRHLGDIVISQPQAARQAAEIGHALSCELRFLCLHGLLHLLGYDHETDNGEMLELQSELKSKLHLFFQGG